MYLPFFLSSGYRSTLPTLASASSDSATRAAGADLLDGKAMARTIREEVATGVQALVAKVGVVWDRRWYMYVCMYGKADFGRARLNGLPMGEREN